MGQLQLVGDAGEQAAGDEFHRHQDRRAHAGADGRTDGGGGDHRRPAVNAADHGGLRPRALGVVADADGGVQRRRAAAHIGEHGLEIGHHRVQPALRHGAAAGAGIDRQIVGIENEHIVVVEEGLQPEADLAVRPFEIEVVADVADGRRRMGDALDLAQHAAALRAQRLREQLLFVLDGDVVGALGRGEHRHHDADDGDGHDHADRDHDAQARAIPIGERPFLNGARTTTRPARWSP